MVEEGATEDSCPTAAPTRPIPEEGESNFNSIQEAIEASLPTAAQEATARAEDTSSALLKSRIRTMPLITSSSPFHPQKESSSC